MRYLALCLIVPLAWGVLVAWILNAQDRKRRASDLPPPANADMYEI